MRHLVADEIWAVLGPTDERCHSKMGPGPALPDRMFFEVALYRAITSVS